MTETSSKLQVAPGLSKPSRGRFILGTVKKPSVVLSLVVVVGLVVVAVAAPLLGNPEAIDGPSRLLSPTLQHPFGTDELGRSSLARFAYAGRLTLLIALGAMILSVLLGAVWGLMAAGFKGIGDDILMRIADAFLAIPMILFALLLVATLGSNVVVLIVIMGILKAPLTARVVRAATMRELSADYVTGVTVVGLSKFRILISEVLPNILPTLVAQATLNFASAVILEATLSFMGLGVQPPEATWGSLMKQGYTYLFSAQWLTVMPAIAVVLLVTATNTLGQRMQAALDGRSD